MLLLFFLISSGDLWKLGELINRSAGKETPSSHFSPVEKRTFLNFNFLSFFVKMRSQLLLSFLLVCGSAKATLDFLDPFLDNRQDNRVGGGAGLGGGLAASGSVGSGLGNNLGFDASGSLAASKSLDLGGNNFVQPLQPQIVQEWPRWSQEHQCWLDEFGRRVPAPRQIIPQQRPIIQQQGPIIQTPPCDHNVRVGGPGPNNGRYNNGPNYQRHGRSQQDKDKMDEKMMEEMMKNNSTKNETQPAGGHKRSTPNSQDGGPVLVIEHIQLIPLFNATNATDSDSPQKRSATSSQDLPVHTEVQFTSLNVTKVNNATNATDSDSPHKRSATSSQENPVKTEVQFTSLNVTKVNNATDSDSPLKRSATSSQDLPVKTVVQFTSLNVTKVNNATNKTNATSEADRTISPKLSGVAHMFHNILGA